MSAAEEITDIPPPTVAANTNAPQGFVFLSEAELDEPLKPIDWAVKALGICPGRPAALVGMGYSGKTWFAIYLAMCVACGSRMFGQFACAEGDVVHLDFEMGKRATKRRYRRICHGHGIPWDVAKKRLKLAVYPKTFLNSPECEAELTRAVAGARLCIIDSLRRSLPGEDENDSRIAQYLDMLARVSEATGCAFVLVHHDSTKINTAKRDKRSAGRGSSVIFDGSGSFIVIDGPEGQPPTVTHVREPQEDGRFSPFVLDFEDVPDGTDPKAGLRLLYRTPEQMKGAEPAHKTETDVDRVVGVVDRHGGARGASAAKLRTKMRQVDRIKMSNDAFADALALAHENGLVENVGTEGSPLWRAAEDDF